MISKYRVLSYNHFSTIGYIDARMLRNCLDATPLQVVVEAVAISNGHKTCCEVLDVECLVGT